MKHLLHSLCFFFVASSSFAQVVWDKSYAAAYNGYVNQIVETTDDAYFVTTPYHYAKISKSGDTLFSNLKKRSQPDELWNACAPLHDGWVVLVGEKNQGGKVKAHVRVLNATGEEVKSRVFENAYSISDVVAEGRHIYLSFKSTTPTFNTVWNVLSNLDSLWSALPAGSSSVGGLKLAMTTTKLLVVRSNGQSAWLDYSGNLLSTTQTFNPSTYLNITSSILQKENAFYCLLNYSKLVKLSAQADSLSQYTFDGFSIGRGFVIEPFGFTFLSNINHDRWQFDMVDEQFNPLFSKSFELKGGKSTATLLKDKDGYYVFGGDDKQTSMRVLKYKSERLVTGLEEEVLLSKSGKQVVRIISPTGQVWSSPELAPASGIYLYQYSDGSVEKIGKF